MDKITLDNWTPTFKKRDIIPSKWRKEQVGYNKFYKPTLDDLRKIKMYIKRGVADNEITKAFCISQKRLDEIKNNEYSPVNIK